jgi:hypothetical protein
MFCWAISRLVDGSSFVPRNRSESSSLEMKNVYLPVVGGMK